MSRESMRASGLTILILLLPAILPAQDWVGRGRASGTVLDAEGEPLAGARVTLVRPESDSGPATVETDRRGRWAVLGLAPGLWTVRVTAPGHRAAEGRVVVPETGPGAAADIRLRSLEVVTPSFSEGNPQTVAKWMETGDSLVAQGDPARARLEYEKAAAALDGAERAAALLLVARTWYLQGDGERAVETLEEALRLDPGSDQGRQVYLEVMQDRGETGRAQSFLDELPASPGTGTSPQRWEPDLSPAARAQLGLPLFAPKPHRRGTYRVAFTDPSPLSRIETFVERTGYDLDRIRGLDPDGGDHDPSGDSFQVVVPQTYTADGTWGLFVWVSPTDFGGTIWEGLRAVLAESRLIWIGANLSGNGRHTWDRYHLGLDAAHHMSGLYELDPDRIYVAGYSGGGRVAGGLSLLYPRVFRGGLWYMGCSWYEALPVPDRPGHRWRPGFRKPTRQQLRQAHARNRYVLVTGERDFNRAECREVAEAMTREGFEHVAFLDIPGLDHYTRAGIEWWRKALAALDGD